jgi:hypothetical protein
MKIRNKKISVLLVSVFICVIGYAQKIEIPDEIIKLSHEQYLNDSLNFVEKYNNFMNSRTKDELEDAASRLDYPTRYKWIRLYSEEIVQKTGNTYKTNSHLAELLSLTNVPDSIRYDLLNGNHRRNLVCRARLGDSVAIEYYIKKYISARDAEDESYRWESVYYYAKILLFFNSEPAIKTVIMDLESSRIIRQCALPDDDPDDCMITHRTLITPILEALMARHEGVPLLYRGFVRPLVMRAKMTLQERNPYVPEYFHLLEEFIKKEYGYTVKINVPYIIAVE